MTLRWIAPAISARMARSCRSSFEGSLVGYIGWYLLLMISFVTIIGWAWVTTAWMRWNCRNIAGTPSRSHLRRIGSRRVVANDRVCVRLRVDHSHPVDAALSCAMVHLAGWPRGAWRLRLLIWRMISAQTLRVCREGYPVPTFPDHARNYLRSRTEPSCATDATSVPSGLKIRPRVSPRPPCALGESFA